MSRTYRITTLGCRVNHAESREIESILRSRGLERSVDGRSADLEVIHTCSVTNTAAAKSRHAVRRARRRLGLDGGGSIDEAAPGRSADVADPGVIVTGCFVSTNPGDARSLAGSGVVPHVSDDGSTMLTRFARRLDAWLHGDERHDPIRTDRESGSNPNGILSLPVIMPETSVGRHVRAELKIQDGCDANCTFCILPDIRSTLRSKTPADAVREATRLVDLGHAEIVLSGIFIGAYGHETALRRRQSRRGLRHPLADLLDAVANVPGLQRLRISSMEPGDVDERLLDAMAANMPVVVPHLHLPLQSGSDAILRRMNRQYRVADYLEMLAMVGEHLTTPDGLPPALTTDIICGFPGETDDDFEATVSVARHAGYLHMHVFPFSPKTGTAAARWTDRFVSPLLAKARVRRLIDLEEDPIDGLSIRWRRRLRGRSVRVILEQPHTTRPDVMTGRCDHYALVTVPTARPRGTLVSVTITDVTADATHGRLDSQRPLTILQPSEQPVSLP